ncbi:hypothetical protein CKO11_05575 [Rhodobacter sp. TJ_12]|uniref:M20 family metallopeptidase n=1 Tax=Rhodobacter sp. TJ_12 TaxID=2029399 RepID=UPI001CBAC2D7|nr:M20 family metallopeptidase [Rhodobacter sp. TJ_12]MBZ4021929.1 hypothetical protein [Rhodobacter sp. TJ_12]
MLDVVDLTRRLVAFDTVNPPGREADVMAFCADLLRDAGFDCQLTPFGAGRRNLLASKGLEPGRAALAFSGHLDTVPLGAQPWRYDPHEAVVAEGAIHGRGSSDMKGGVAAFLLAAIRADVPPGGLVILLTAGEETGAEGARAMAAAPLPKIGAMIVAESTLNRPVQGHKGALWLRLTARGKTAHGAMPHHGVNAVMKMAHALTRLEGLSLGPAHEVMGPPTQNLGTIAGGLNTNSVPDRCTATLDLRSVPGVTHDDLHARVAKVLGAEIQLERLIDLPAVWTEPAHPWMAALARHAARLAGADTTPAVVSYFTDASIFTPVLGEVPTMILGPGDPALAHQTDEYVQINRLTEAQAIYGAAIADWTGAP